MWDYRVPDGPVALSGHTGRVQAITFSTDSTRVLTHGDDKTARVWLAATGAQMALHTFPDFVTDTAFNPDGTMVATASRVDRSCSGTPRLVPSSPSCQVIPRMSPASASALTDATSPPAATMQLPDYGTASVPGA